MNGKQHVRKKLNPNTHICKRYGKILVETKNDLASTVLLSAKFTKGENSSFETVNPTKIQPQLIDNQKLGTYGLDKRRD